MVVGVTAYVFYCEGEQGRDTSAHKVGDALSRLNSDFTKMQVSNREFAARLAHDSALTTALNKQDRPALSTLFKNASNARRFAGTIAVFDGTGTVVYSTDAPTKFGYNMRGKNAGIDYVLNGLDNFTGLTAALTVAQPIAVTAMVPIIGEGGKCQGIVAVSESLNEEFFTGEAMKFALLSESLSDIDFILLAGRDNNYFCLTPGLLKDKPAFVQQLSERGAKAMPGWQEPSSGWQVNDIFKWLGNLLHGGTNIGAGFVRDGRFWQQYNLSNIGFVVATTTIHAQGIKPGFIIIITCVLGLLAFVLAVVFSAKINNVESPGQALMGHLKAWQADLQPPPASGFSGVWHELAELIDQTLAGKQHYIQALKLQLNKTTQQVNEIAKEGQTADGQFAALDRQVANQNRQLSEFSRQLNYANQQNVFLQQELQAILQSTTEGFLVLDGYGNVLSCNNIFLNWLGASEAEIAGRFCFDLVQKPGEKANEVPTGSDLGRAFVKHESNTAALIEQFFPEGAIHHAKSGQAVEVLLHLQPIAGQDNNIQGYILVVRDKSLRSEIVKLRMEMINMLTRAVRAPLISAEKEWQSLLGSDGEFKSSQALELNQKLTNEKANFFQNAGEKFEPAVEHRLNDLHSRYQNLIRSVESLLSAHGQSSEQLAITPQNDSQLVEGLDNIFPRAEALPSELFPITRLIGDCLEEVAGIARGRHLVLDHKTSTAMPNIRGNRAVIKSILAPIIDKIINSTDSGGKVRVESTFQDKEIKLGISSSGPALAEEEIVDMFAGFIPEKHSEDTYGARLSLYLARNNAERIGAHVWAQSVSGRGTTIYITLPVG